jgi:hypothetical protein
MDCIQQFKMTDKRHPTSVRNPRATLTSWAPTGHQCRAGCSSSDRRQTSSLPSFMRPLRAAVGFPRSVIESV